MLVSLLWRLAGLRGRVHQEDPPGDAPPSEGAATPGRRGAPLLKRAMRALYRRLPRSDFSYNVGKLALRTALRPARGREPVAVRFGGGFRVELDLGDFTSNDLYCLDSHYEASTLNLWRRLAASSACVVDVGSHLGIYALTAAEANPGARVLAVEPHGGNFSLLRRHCAPYPNVGCANAAVSSGRGRLWFCPDAGNTGGGYLSPRESPGCHPVETRSLAEVCAGLAGVDLLKIDVEGHERTLLMEDSDFWEAHRPEHVIVEIRRDRSTRAADRELFSTMRRLGYSARRVQGLHALPFLGPGDLANWHFYLDRGGGGP